jgi:hypothetical protein
VGEIIYRLPTDKDEPLSRHYWTQYYQTKFFVASPVMQVYFYMHRMTAAQLARGALLMAKISRDGGMDRAAHDWKVRVLVSTCLFFPLSRRFFCLSIRAYSTAITRL